MKCIDDEIPFEIPQGWEWSRLGDICSYLHRGKSPKYGEHKILPIIAQKCNQWDKIYTDRCLFSSKNYIEKYKEEQFVQEGDIIINSTGGGTVGRTGYIDSYVFTDFDKFVVDSHLTLVRSIYPIASKYIYYFLISPLIQIGLEDRCSGSTNQIELGTTTIVNYLVPIPPINEQHRIIEQIQKILPLIEKYSVNQIAQDKLNTEINDKLKKSILQEAIQGRLVPQIVKEGTAQELFEQIRTEKKRLVKEGKLKKSTLSDSVIYKGDDNKYFEKIGKTVTEVTDEIPFEIPITWQWIRIKDIFQINPKNIAGDNCISAFIPMEKIYATYGSEFSYDEVQWKTIKIGYTHFADGDVAFAKITPCFQNRKSVIFCNLPNGIGAGTTELKVLRQFGETINRWYLLFFLESPYFIDEATFKGTANQQRIISGYLENKLFPLPPLQEQNRIEKQIKAIASIMSR